MIHKLFPKEYRQFLEYISPAVFSVIDWKTAIAKTVAVSKNAFDENLVSVIAEHNAELFPANVRVQSIRNVKSVAPKPSDVAAFAELVLEIYFSQFFSNKGCFLDLRSINFAYEGDSVIFSPGSIVHAFESDFRIGMIDIYQGYYLGNPDAMKRGMTAVGLVTGTDPDEVDEIQRLLFSHFGNADQGPVTFSLNQFKESFHQLFLYLKRKDITLNSDFLFLGMYLVTLYMTLSKPGVPVDVKKCFSNVWARVNSKSAQRN